MTTTILTTNLTGAGPQFTFAAAGDAVIIASGVTIGSTNSSAITNGLFTDVEVSVLGTLINNLMYIVTTNSSFNIGPTGSLVSFEPSFGNAALLMSGSGSTAQIDGSLYGSETIGILASSGNNVVTVTGKVQAASGVFLGLGGASGDVLTNSGTITAGTADDATANQRFNNAVHTEGAGTRITNLAGGSLTATSSQGNGVRAVGSIDGTVITNHGTITSAKSAGVAIAGTVAGSVSLNNTGTISGVTAVDAAGSTTAIRILNSGRMLGNVILGTGSDRYDGRGDSLVTGQIVAGLGDDMVLGGDGQETLFGDDGLDTLSGGGGDDNLNGGVNADSLRGDAGNDALSGGADLDTLFGGSGDDTLASEGGGLMGFGGAGDDAIFSSGDANDALLSVSGGGGDDMISGSAGADNATGDAGDDSLIGLAGDDQLFGGRGDDTLNGGDQNDALDGGAEDDVLDGGNGLDSLYGGSGDDLVYGGADNDTIEGGAGEDVLFGGLGIDRISGGAGADSLLGESGNDTMSGGAGDDTLVGGVSADILTGGIGADVFVLTLTVESGTTAALRDKVTDFQSGVDRLDLTAIDANSLLAGNQAFTFIGSGPYTLSAGQLRYTAATGVVEGDVNGDGVADFSVELQNLPLLVAGDILL